MAKELCRNRTYETKLISHLPHKYSFADGSKSLVIDYTTTEQLGQCRKMIEEAALRGDNVGVDEYEKDSESLQLLLQLSEIFQALNPVSGNLEAFLLIQPCIYQRTYDPCTASIYVFRSKDIDDEVYGALMNLVAEFAQAIDRGYTQCFTQVALCLHGLYSQLRRRGFLSVAVLPNWVNIAGSGLGDNAIMVKDFGLPDKPMRSPEEVKRMLESHLTPERMFKEYTSVDIPQIPSLPKAFLENGTRMVLRNARKDEDIVLYQMLFEAAEKGEGYSLNEFPSIDSMRLETFVNSYTALIEEENTNKLIGFLIFHDAAMSRSGKGKICDESIIVSEELRGKGFGRSLNSMARFVRNILGYERVLREAFISNNRILKLWKHDGVSVCGVLPRSAFQKGVGWVDLVLSVLELDRKH